MRIALELEERQIEQLVEQLSPKAKQRLVNRLAHQDLGREWDRLLAEIRHRRPARALSMEEIQREVNAVRAARHVRRRP